MNEDSKEDSNKNATLTDKEDEELLSGKDKSKLKVIPYISAILNVTVAVLYLYFYFTKSKHFSVAKDIEPFFSCFVIVQVFISISILVGMFGKNKENLSITYVEWCLGATIYLLITLAFIDFSFQPASL